MQDDFYFEEYKMQIEKINNNNKIKKKIYIYIYILFKW